MERLKIGSAINHIDGEFTAIINSINEAENEIIVLITGTNPNFSWGENWNLAHTVSGLNDGTYRITEQ